jgi:hypothetical protein
VTWEAQARAQTEAAAAEELWKIGWSPGDAQQAGARRARRQTLNLHSEPLQLPGEGAVASLLVISDTVYDS